MRKNIPLKVNRYLKKLAGEEDARLILNKFGQGKSFLNTICCLPAWMNESFDKKISIKNLDLESLAEANLKAWIGYTIYDYLRDKKWPEHKVPKLISIANILTQDSLNIFLNNCKTKIKKQEMLSLFKKIDIYYIKLDDRKIVQNFKDSSNQLHEKSIAAATCAILAIPDSAYKESSRNVLNFFKYYFNARQLSDDLDDFKDDIKNKIVTPVTVLIKDGVSEHDVKKIVRNEIDFNVKKAKQSLCKVKNFNGELFMLRYMKPC